MAYHLKPEERKNLVDKLIKEGKPIGQISKDSGISRPTIYKWLKDYNYANQEGKDFNFKTKKKNIDFYHNQATSEQEKLVLQEVRRKPEASKYEIASNLKSQFPKKALGPTGVYKVLLRNGLNLAQNRERYAYANIRKSAELPTPWVGDLQSFLKTSFVSFLLTFFIALGILAWINLITGASPLQGGVGYIFSGLALTMGTLFFLYSLKYYLTLALVLSFSQEGKGQGEIVETRRKSLWTWLLGLGGRKANDSKKANSTRAGGLEANLEHVRLTRHPFVSIHIPLYNEKNVVSRVLKASTSFEYEGEYEVIICDDSTDDTTTIINSYIKNNCVAPRSFSGVGWTLTQAEVRPGVILKHLHRTSRQGFKGGALGLALKFTDPRAEFISVFDADFVPYPDTLTLFLKYFSAVAEAKADGPDYAKASTGRQATGELKNLGNIAAVQGYQWHVLNKSENWITRGIRSEYSGSYVIERSGEEIYGGLKQISGSVYMVRRDILEEIGWGTSITEDFELTLRLYAQGYKVVYTPYIQAPAECVSTIKSLVRQRMRWAEGHSNNIKRMFVRLMFGKWQEERISGNQDIGDRDEDISLSGLKSRIPRSADDLIPSKVWIPSPLTFSEKLEFLYLSPYYLQAFFFLIGTLSWLVSETVFKTHLPFWTELWGWSLVLTNLLALPLMNAVGLFLEESEEKDYAGLASFVALSYILVPFQAYASLKGFLESSEGPWFRTPKTGRITDIFTRGRFYRFIQGILPRRAPALQALGTRHWGLEFSLKPNRHTLNPNFLNPFSIRPRRIRWVSKATLAVLLVVVVFLNNLAFFANTTNAQAADPGIEQQINIIDQEYSTTSTSSAPTDNSLGYIYWDSAKYSGTRTINLDIVGRTSATSAQMIAALYDDSGGIVSQSKATIGNANKIAHLDGCVECDGTGSILYITMVLDSSGYPVITYSDSTVDNLKLIHCGNANCTSGNVVTTIDGSGCTPTGCSSSRGIQKHKGIVLNPSSGYPVISYYNSTNVDLMLVVCGNANCTSGNTYQTVDGCASSPCANNQALGSYASMVLDSNNYPIITYFNEADDDLMFVHCGSTACLSSPGNTYVRLDGCTGCTAGLGAGQTSGGSTGQYSSIQLDGSGYPVVAYRDGTPNHDLKLVHCGDANCTVSSATFNIVDDGANATDSAGVYNSLKLDNSGNPVISFGRGQFGVNLDLKFIHCGDVNCDSETGNAITLDGQGPSATLCAEGSSGDCDSGDVGWYNKLQLDTTSSACASSPKRCPIISYRSQVAGDLKVIHCNDNDCSGNNDSVKRVDGCPGCDTDGSTPQTGTGAYTSLVLDSSGYPVISYRTVGDSEDLKVVHCGNADCNPTGSGQVDPTNNQRAESIVFTPNLTGGATTRNLTVRVWVTSGTGYIRAARLRIIQNDATRITDTQTQIELGDDQIITATSYGELTNPKYYLYCDNATAPCNKQAFSGTKSAYFEASLKGEGSSQGDGRIWSSGFELASVTAGEEYTFINGSPETLTSPTPRSGSYLGRVNNTGAEENFNYQWATSNQTANYYFRSYIYVDVMPTNTTPASTILRANSNGATARAGIKLTSAGKLQLWNLEDGAQVGSDSTTTLVVDTWYRVEFRVDTTTIGSTSVDARLDGTSFASGTIDLAAGIARFLLGTEAGDSTLDIDYDDVAINDTTGSWPGPGKIIHLRPSQAGDNSDWTNDYTYVDEVDPDDGTTLASSNTAGQIDYHNIDDSSIAANDEVNVVHIGVRFNGAGTVNASFKVGVKETTGATAEENTTAITPASTTWRTNAAANPILYPLTLYDLPGSSTTAWSDGTLDTAQIGYDLTSASTSAAQISTVWMLVDYTLNADLAGVSAQAKLQQCDESTGCDAANEWTDVTGSSISSTTSSFQRVRSGDISSNLTSGRRYRVVVQRSSASGTIKIANAKLIIGQTAAGGLTDIELVHQYVNSNTSETATSLTAKDFDNEFDDDNFVGGTFAYYYEATMYCTTGCTGTSDLYNGTSTITNSSINDTSETPIRKRSSSALSSMPTTATNLDTRLQATSGDTTYANTSWLIIQVSGLQVPENLLLFLPFVLFIPKILAKGTFKFPNFNPVSFLPKQEDFKRRRKLWRREIFSR